MRLTKRYQYKALGEAAEFIAKYCSRYGLITVDDYKTKYDEVRVYVTFGIWSIHNIIYPGYHYTQEPKWLFNFIDNTVLGNTYVYKILCLINKLIIPYQRFIYNRAYNKAVHKYFYVAPNIINGMDYSEEFKMDRRSEHIISRYRLKEIRKQRAYIKSLELKIKRLEYNKNFDNLLKNND